MPDSFVADHVRRELMKRKVEFNRVMKAISKDRKIVAKYPIDSLHSDCALSRLFSLMSERDNLSAEIYEKKRILDSA